MDAFETLDASSRLIATASSPFPPILIVYPPARPLSFVHILNSLVFEQNWLFRRSKSIYYNPKWRFKILLVSSIEQSVQVVGEPPASSQPGKTCY